jgi:acyl dehydratase
MSERTLTLTGDAIRAYSRRGNYHSDPETAQQLGLPGLVAQGVQVLGPAYGALLDAWGDDFLERGEIDVRFVGLVTEDQTVRARVDVTGDDAHIEVHNETADRLAVVGTARRTTDAGSRP